MRNIGLSSEMRIDHEAWQRQFQIGSMEPRPESRCQAENLRNREADSMRISLDKTNRKYHRYMDLFGCCGDDISKTCHSGDPRVIDHFLRLRRVDRTSATADTIFSNSEIFTQFSQNFGWLSFGQGFLQ